jgi:hypothetical protein
MITSLVKPPEDISSAEIETAVEVKSLVSLQERLDRAITVEINAKIISQTRTLNDITSDVKKELILFEIEGKRGPTLEKVYNDLNTIPPTSVESERGSSDCGNFETKIRSSLNNESLDMLSFLKAYFKSDNLKA